MSASLVGSEMCIRDRITTSRGHMGKLPLGWSRATNATTVVATEKGTAPVSYTHLTLPTICSV
eukprot:6158568-Alexandrium_andersonii.AAC.1